MKLHGLLRRVVVVAALTHVTGCADRPSILDPPLRSPEVGGPLLAVAPTTLTLVSGAGAIGGQDAANPVSTDGGATFRPANIIATHPAYANPLPGSQWIAPPGPVAETGSYLYCATFAFPADYSAPSLDIRVHADNYAVIRLNGNVIGSQPARAIAENFQGSAESFSTANAAFFQAGMNVLEIQVVDLGRPTGLDYVATAKYTSGTPTLSATREILSNAVAGDATSCGVTLTLTTTRTLTATRDTLSNVGVGDDPSAPRFYSTVELTVTTTPRTPGLTIQFRVSNNSVPETHDGHFLSASNSVTNIADDLGKGIYQIRYVAKAETEEDICASDMGRYDKELKEQTITIEARGPGNARAEIKVDIRSRFNFLVSRDPPLYDAAIEYVLRKYRIDYPFHSTVRFVENLRKGVMASTSFDDHVSVGREAFASENLLASTLIHELVHVGESIETQTRAGMGKTKYEEYIAAIIRGEEPYLSQTNKDRIREWAQMELRAYRKQLADAGERITCLNEGDKEVVQSRIDDFKIIEQDFPAGRNVPPRRQPPQQDAVPRGQARPADRKSHGLSDH